MIDQILAHLRTRAARPAHAGLLAPPVDAAATGEPVPLGSPDSASNAVERQTPQCT